LLDLLALEKSTPMQAAIYTQYGSPEVIQIKTTPTPIPKDNEVLVKIHTTSVNRTDCGFLRAKPFIARFFSGLFRPKNQILGNEFAGEITAIGKNVQSFKIGDKVFGMNGVSFGTHAQYTCLPEDGAIAPLPPNLPLAEAGGICEGAFYALTNFFAIPHQPGESILINGSTGAIGTAAVQLAKYYGLKITAVGNTKNIELVKSLGADRVIDYLKEDFTKILDGPFDYIFDAVGKSTFGKCKHLLKPNGVFFATELGPYWQNVFFALWCSIFGKMPFQSGKKVLFPLPDDSKARKNVIFFKELIEQGALRSVIDKRYTLSAIQDAYRYVELGEKTGSVIIDMPQ